MSPNCLRIPARDVEMVSDEASGAAAQLMSEFATRTGLVPPAQDQQRYLWTDAFAVCNFLELFERTGRQEYRRCATDLIDQVHRVLGRYRNDDIRTGWISGFDDETGRSHPTAAGLRIGKPLKERGPDESIDERLEWDRDGQYFHYLTKWMHALCRAAIVTGNTQYALGAVELAQAAFKGFARRSRSGELVGVYWKTSIDLTRPLVPATGLHDALDGFITFQEVQDTIPNMLATSGMPDLSSRTESFFALCRQRDWTTDDPLGLGGLLFDASRLCRLSCDADSEICLLQDILRGCRNGLAALLASHYLRRPASHRLAFRELGLAIGLKALPIIADAVSKLKLGLASRTALRRDVDPLLKYESLGEDIIAFWLPAARHKDHSWQDHQNINDVMLATALIPDMFLALPRHPGAAGPV